MNHKKRPVILDFDDTVWDPRAMKPYPLILETLKALSEVCIFFLLTSCSGKLQEQKQKIGMSGIKQFIPEERIFIVDDYEAKKPEMLNIVGICLKAGYLRSDICVVGDKLYNELKFAKWLDLLCIHVQQGPHAGKVCADPAVKADHVINKFEELHSLLLDKSIS